MTRQLQKKGLPARGLARKAPRRARVAAFALVTALAAGGLGLAAHAESAAMGKVNVNEATVEELQRLPGVGESRAQALVEERRRRGGFESIDELVEVKGIGAASLEKLRPHVTLHGSTTVSAE